MINSFIKYLQFEKRSSAHTVSAYQTDLSQFEDYLRETYHENNIVVAEHGLIRSWIASLVESAIDPRSVNRKIACLRTFYKYLLRQDIIKKDPMLKIRVLKTKKKLPAFVKETDMVNLLDNNFPVVASFESSRERLVLELLYGTGIRRSELLSLKEGAIDFNNQTIKVLGKRNKERIIPFSKHLVLIIREYQEMKRKNVPIKNDFLCVTDSGDACYPVLINRIVKKYLSLYTSADKKSPHVLRHTYATHLLNNGAEINAVKDLLGHSSLAATQVYTHNSLEKLKKAFDQAHPKA
jgi:integrase/recombinase XerC